MIRGFEMLAMSKAKPGYFYQVRMAFSCECRGFAYRGYCRHLREMADQLLTPPEASKEAS